MSPNRLSYVRSLRAIGASVIVSTAAMVVLSGGEAQPSSSDTEQRPADAIVAAHDCSVFGYGDDLIPSHAVVDVGAGPQYVTSDLGFAIMGGAAGTLYAFCR